MGYLYFFLVPLPFNRRSPLLSYAWIQYRVAAANELSLSSLPIAYRCHYHAPGTKPTRPMSYRGVPGACSGPVRLWNEARGTRCGSQAIAAVAERAAAGRGEVANSRSLLAMRVRACVRHQYMHASVAAAAAAAARVT